MALAAGTRLGAYEITGELGVGGMGEVYRATDTNLKRDVAIKILPEAFASDADRIARFQREAEALAALNHSNIAQIYGLERSGESTALAMELVEGPTLADRIAEGPIPVDEALGIAAQIADALEAAHEQHIVHRDLKPANIKLRSDGTVKVLDFGIATAPQSGTTTSGQRSPTLLTPALTEAGVLLGTAAYMSPEQARGRAVDQRADIWAFGCVLYEMLTGQPAFGAEDVTMTLARVIEREANTESLPGTVSPAVRHTIQLCLEKDPRRRIADMRDVRLALEGAFEAAAPGPIRKVNVRYWQRPLPVAIAAFLAGAILASLAVWRNSQPEPRSVTRFDYDLPLGRSLRNVGRPAIALSPDGRNVAYNTSLGLYVRAMGVLESRLLDGTEPALTSPVFSPDGQSTVYWDGDSGQLKRLAINGGAPLIVADDVVNPFGLKWETDGTILIGQPQGILRVSENGGTLELIVRAEEGERIYGPSLLPNRDSVLFSTTRGEWDESQIVAQSLSTGERTVLVEGGTEARYLPTGHLLYAFDDTLFARAFDPDELTVSGGVVPVVEGVMRANAAQTGVAHYDVSNDGTLAYITGTSAERALVWVDREGHDEAIPIPSGDYSAVRLSGDGTRAAFSGPDAVWVVDLEAGTRARLTTGSSDNRAPV